MYVRINSPYCAHRYCASVALDQIETTFLDFLHPLIWLSVNHVSLSNLSCQLSNMLTFATIHFDTILCHTLFICTYGTMYVYKTSVGIYMYVWYNVRAQNKCRYLYVCIYV